MPAVRWLTEAEGIAPDALDGVVVSVGPGGFSALRTGIGVAKGLAVAWGLPVAGVSTLEASAYPYRQAAERICAVLPAGRGTVAWAVYSMSGGGMACFGRRAGLLRFSAFAAAQSGETLFCGESAADLADALRERMGADARSVTEPAPLVRLAGVAEIGAVMLASGQASGASSITPRYLRSPRHASQRAETHRGRLGIV